MNVASRNLYDSCNDLMGMGSINGRLSVYAYYGQDGRIERYRMSVALN